MFPTQGLNPGLPHCRHILYHLSYKGRLDDRRKFNQRWLCLEEWQINTLGRWNTWRNVVADGKENEFMESLNLILEEERNQ